MTAMDGPILNKRVSPLDGIRFSLKSSFVLRQFQIAKLQSFHLFERGKG
jgi:hypothetical protein